MDKFVAFMEKHFIPVASKIGAQRHLVAIRDSFMVMSSGDLDCELSKVLLQRGFLVLLASASLFESDVLGLKIPLHL